MLFLGGDHFITYPCFDFVQEGSGHALSLLYFDAHPDLYENYEGNPNSHATVVSRILERKERESGKVCYVGIRASTREQDQRISALGLTAHTTHDVYAQGCEAVSFSVRSFLRDELVYLSFDLDCLDPAYAPGAANPQPGGLTTRQVLEIMHGIAGLRIVAADVVEYAPEFDSAARTTAFTSAILIKEMMGIMGQSV
jgi:agmatinase